VSPPIAANSQRSITLRGVRTHNLKNISLSVPLDGLVVVTGVSGAGKSSLALDTLYAEGQRRYVETFSPYARQFLDKLDKPDADQITGIPAAIAVGQSHGRHSSRSTVGTITEIHDALGLLFARSGQVAVPRTTFQSQYRRNHHRDPRRPRPALRPVGPGVLPPVRFAP
jgi:excinuclease ABC subunit A